MHKSIGKLIILTIVTLLISIFSGVFPTPDIIKVSPTRHSVYVKDNICLIDMDVPHDNETREIIASAMIYCLEQHFPQEL